MVPNLDALDLLTISQLRVGVVANICESNLQCITELHLPYVILVASSQGDLRESHYMILRYIWVTSSRGDLRESTLYDSILYKGKGATWVSNANQSFYVPGTAENKKFQAF